MKKISLLLGMFFIAITSLSAQLVVDAEMFKSNPNNFMGKVVTIKNVSLISSNCHNPKISGVVNAPISSTSVGGTSPAPVGVAGKNSYCNPQPNLTLTKWSLGPQNELCVQIDNRLQPMLNTCQPGKNVKSITFRVTPTMYLATRIEP
jgi:hypothetical protein